MKSKVINLMVCLFFILMGLSACGGSDTPTATGKFVDAPVEGLKYVSGGHNGFTGSGGEFTYEVGKTVTFSVGGVVIGNAPGASTVTPVDLVKTAAAPGATVDASTAEVIQIARFLLTACAVTSTGIKIDSAVTEACASQSINLSTASDTIFTQAINQIAATAGNRPVTTATDAQDHITASMAALSSGSAPVLPSASITGGGAAVPTPTYTISGTVTATGGTPIPGVTITAAGSTTTTATTATDGSFSFAGAQNGSYTLTASLSGFTFTPSSLTAVVDNANVTEQNFNGTATVAPATYTISGKVTTAAGVAISGVTVSATGATTTTTTTATITRRHNCRRRIDITRF